MGEVEIAPTAISVIKAIIDYVFKESVQSTEKLYHEFTEKIYSLQHFPERGKIVREIANPQIRETNLYHSRIIYKLEDLKVPVLTIHHSASLLSNNPNFPKSFE